MKRFTSLMIASSLLLPGLATAKSLQTFRAFEGKGAEKSVSVQKVNRERTSLRQSVNSLAKAPAGESEDPDLGPIITEAPEGKVVKYVRSGSAYLLYWGAVKETKYEGKPSEIVECENGDVYFKNPISQFATNGYLKGKKVGDTYEFELPQALYSEVYEGETYTYMLTNMRENPEKGGTFYAVNTDEYRDLGFEDIDNKLVMTVVDGVITYEPSRVPGEEDPVIGLFDNYYEFSGYGETSSYMIELNDNLVEVPAGLATEEYAVCYGEDGNFCEVGFDGDDVYVKGLFKDAPDAWIKGIRDGDKITFEKGQYLGENANYGFYTYFMTGVYAPKYNEKTGLYDDWWDMNEAAVFSFDEKEKKMTTDEDQTVFYNTSKDRIYYITLLMSPVIAKQPDNINTNPANPYDLSFVTGNYIYFDFYVTPFNVDGYLMDSDWLYYKIFIDGDEYTFNPDEYKTLEEEMTLIPFNFTENWDIFIKGNERQVYFYSEGFDEVGVQMYCYRYDAAVDGDVLVGQSDLMTVSTTGVKTVGAAESKTIVSTKYCNMAGQEVSNPTQGIFVKTVSYADGSVKSFKVIKK